MTHHFEKVFTAKNKTLGDNSHELFVLNPITVVLKRVCIHLGFVSQVLGGSIITQDIHPEISAVYKQSS